MTARPTVLFVCVHNAGRSQMAAGYLQHLAGDRVEVLSAGSQPAEAINPVAVEAMAEEGVDITAAQPKVLTTDAVEASDVVVTMGCGDECPYFPGKRYEDWVLDDPAGQGLEAVRSIRDEIRRRVVTLLHDLLPAGEDAVAELERWAASGGHWRVLDRSSDRFTVGLFTCDGGEEMGRLASADPALRAYVGDRTSSDD